MLLDGIEPVLRAGTGVTALAGMDAAAVARGSAGRDPVARALGFAAINAPTATGWSAPARRCSTTRSRGERWGAFAAKYVIARHDYPGVERLLARVA